MLTVHDSALLLILCVRVQPPPLYECIASLSRRFLFQGVSLAELFPLSKHSADVATAHTHTLYKYTCSVVSVTTIALASVHWGFQPGCAISCVTIRRYTGHPDRQAHANRQM